MPDWKQRASAKSRVAENGEIPAHPLLRCEPQFGGGPFMKATSVFILAGALAMSGSALHAQGGAQASSSASSSTSVQADKSGAAASNNTSTSASANAGQNSASLSSGTAMNAALTQPVDAKKNK